MQIFTALGIAVGLGEGHFAAQRRESTGAFITGAGQLHHQIRAEWGKAAAVLSGAEHGVTVSSAERLARLRRQSDPG